MMVFDLIISKNNDKLYYHYNFYNNEITIYYYRYIFTELY